MRQVIHRFWKLKLQQYRHKTIPSSRLEYYRTAANVPVTDGILTEQEILRSVQSARSDLKEFQSRQRELRASHLEQLAEAIVLNQSPHLSFDSVEHIKEERKVK
jgi:hypothetical protein